MEAKQTAVIMAEETGANLPVQLGATANFFVQEAKATGTRRAYLRAENLPPGTSTRKAGFARRSPSP